ncbi:MAG: OmpL47-type beta-barrel domain-containing protein [Thermoplasmata archaeon]
MWARRFAASVLALVMVSSMLWAFTLNASAEQGYEDEYGYKWTDSNPPAPQVGFNWVEIELTGTDTGLFGDDNYAGPLPIGFTFSFYGNSYTDFYVSTNGLVTFGGGSWMPQNYVIPYPWDTNNMLAVYWDNLYVDPAAGPPTGVYYQTLGSAPNRQLVVEWVDVVELGDINLMTFEAVLNETGEIWFQYNTLNGRDGWSATVGIESLDGWMGTQYSYNSPVLHDGLAIRYDVSPVMIGPDSQMIGQPGSTAYYWPSVKNNRAIADSFDITYSSLEGWSVGLYDSMLNPLSDTNGNGIPDTGSVEPGRAVDLIVTVDIPDPPTAPVEETTVFATSYADPAGWDDVLLVTQAAGAQFMPPHSDWAYDSDLDGLYDYLVVDVNIDVILSDAYYVDASLYDQSWNWLASADDWGLFDPGPGTLHLMFDGWRIRQNGVDGPFNVDMSLYDSSWNYLMSDSHTTAAYVAASFELPPAELAPPHSDRGEDTGGDGLYNYLVVDVSVYVNEAGNFEVWSSLWDSLGWWIDEDQNITYLDAGPQVVELRFPGYLIRNHGVDGPYQVYLGLYFEEDDGSFTWLESGSHMTAAYSWSQFNDLPAKFSPPHSERVVDQTGEGLYEYLVVEVSLDVPEPCTIEVSSWLMDFYWDSVCYASNRTHVDAGLQTVELWFPGWEINMNGVSGNFVAIMDLLDAEGNFLDEVMYTTAWYDYAEFQLPVVFTPPHSDRGLDLDGDGLYNYLVIESQVYVLIEDYYSFNLQLFDGFGWFVWWDNNYTYLEVGQQTITWLVPGWLILDHGVDGPYNAYLDAYWGWYWCDSDLHVTQAYPYTQFNGPPATFAPPHDDHGLDTNGNGLYDYLVVDVTVQVDFAGEYQVAGPLFDGFGNYLGYDSNYTYLDVGLQVVQLMYRGWQLNESGYTGQYTVELTLTDSDGVYLDSDTHKTQAYAWSEFDPFPAKFAPPHSDRGEDTDGNGLYDYLVVNASVEVATAGTYVVYAILYSPIGISAVSTEVREDLDVGLQTVELRFPGYVIRSWGESGNFSVYLGLFTGEYERLEEGSHMTSWYAYDQFDYPPLEFVWPHGEYGLDADGDMLYEYLVVLASVDVRVAGTYWIAALVDLGTGVAFRSNLTYLDVGLQTVELRVPGWQFFTHGANGPYGVQLLAFDEELQNQIDDDYFMTNPFYMYDDFDGAVPTIASNWATSPPTIDGVVGAGEWAGAAAVDLSALDPLNVVDTTMLVMNNRTHLFVAYDATGDITEDMDDLSSIGFDTGNDERFTDGGEDEFFLSESISGGSGHLAYDESSWDFEIDCSPFDDSLPGHAGLAGAVGFGPSDGSALDHRMYEFAIPLTLIDAAPGDVLGFMGGSLLGEPGVYDDSIGWWANWPVPVPYWSSLADFGDLVLANFPETTVTLDGTMGLEGWFLSNVTVTLTATGGQGGIDYTMYRVDGGMWTTYAGPFAISGEGVHTLEFYSVDNAGNEEPVQSAEVKIDLRAPVTSASLSGTGSGEWWSSDVTVTLTADDGAGSGVDITVYIVDGGYEQTYSSPFVVSGEGSHVVEFLSKDVAGRNETLASISFSIETVAPTTTCALDGTMGSDGWYVSSVTVTLTATDDPGGSGVAQTMYRIGTGAWQTYTAPFSVSAQGTYNVSYYSVDHAGNVEATKYVEFKVDATAPTTTASISGTLGENGWYTSAATVTLAASDGTGGSGVDTIKYRIGGGAWQTYTAAISVATDGTTTIDFYATDNAGNTEATKSVTVKVDTVAPSSSASVEDGTVTLASTDATSGVARIEYRVDDGAWQTYTAPFEVTGEGNHTVEYRAVDNAGNVEATKTTYVEIEGAGGILGGAALMGIIAAVVIVVALLAVFLLMKRRKKAPGAPEEELPPPPPEAPAS